MDTKKPILENSGMHKGASPRIFQNAKSLRARMTKAEVLLWERLRNKHLGIKFRRQHPVGYYITDFYCHQEKLVIELDGKYHNDSNQKEKDIARAKHLESFGLTVIRFTNEDVYNDIDKVIGLIKNTCLIK